MVNKPTTQQKSKENILYNKEYKFDYKADNKAVRGKEIGNRANNEKA
jgi:hypothetical protein